MAASSITIGAGSSLDLGTCVVTGEKAMTNIYLLSRKDYDLVYATASVVGTFIERLPCPECHAGRRERTKPLVIEWQPGSDNLADFTWPCGLEEVVVTERVKQLLAAAKSTGLDIGPVEMVQDKRVKKPLRQISRARKRIWLPYDGTPLWSLDVNSWCSLDLVLSKRSVVFECKVCHRQEFSITPNAPLAVNGKTWDGSDFFRIRELGRIIFISERLKAEIEAAQFTNLLIEERGRVPIHSGEKRRHG
jgi:hypothetical protein